MKNTPRYRWHRTPPLLIWLVMTGCQQPLAQPASLTLAVDVSSPSVERLNRYGALLYRVQRRLGTGGRLTVLTFAGSSQTIYDGPSLIGRSRFNERIGSEILKSQIRQRNHGTRVELVLEQLAELSSGSSQTGSIVILTDGGVEDQSRAVTDSIKRSVKIIASAQPGQVIILVGVLPEHRRQWQQWLQPLGPRARVFGLSDASDLPQLIGRAK